MINERSLTSWRQGIHQPPHSRERKILLDLITAVIEEGGGEIITLALRCANPDGAEDILSHIPEGMTLLPNTSGARNAEEAVRIAELSRAMGCGNWVKVEVINDSRWLLPDNAETSVPRKCSLNAVSWCSLTCSQISTQQKRWSMPVLLLSCRWRRRSAPTAASCTKQRSRDHRKH